MMASFQPPNVFFFPFKYKKKEKEIKKVLRKKLKKGTKTYRANIPRHI